MSEETQGEGRRSVVAFDRKVRWVRCPDESCGFEYVVLAGQPIDPHPTCDGSAMPIGDGLMRTAGDYHEEVPMEVVHLVPAPSPLVERGGVTDPTPPIRQARAFGDEWLAGEIIRIAAERDRLLSEREALRALIADVAED